MRSLPCTVVIIEDDAALRDTLQEVLTEEGFQVMEARDGREGLHALERVQGPCVVLMDIMMPVLDGHAVLAELHRRPELLGTKKLILCTGSYDYRFGPPEPHCVLRKPYSVPALLRAIDFVCAPPPGAPDTGAPR